MVIVVNGLHSGVNGQFATTQLATTQLATTKSQIAIAGDFHLTVNISELRGYP